MFKQFRQLSSHVWDTIPALSWIDRDKGQLKKPEDFNTIIVPGLLLAWDEVKWQPGTRGAQTGLTSLRVSLCFSLPASTHQVPPIVTNYYPENEALVDDLHNCLSLFDGVGDRRSSFDYFTPQFYVCEMTYDYTLYHEVAPKTIVKPVPEITGELTTTIHA